MKRFAVTLAWCLMICACRRTTERPEASLILTHMGNKGTQRMMQSDLPLLAQATGVAINATIETVLIRPPFVLDAEVYRISSPRLQRPVLVTGTSFDPYEGALIVAALERQFKIDRLVLASSCGLLSDDYAVLDIQLPNRFYRSDYAYHDRDGTVLFFPDWPIPKLKENFEPTYALDLTGSPLLRKLAGLADNPAWQAAMKAALTKSNSPGAKGRTAVRLATDTVHVTGSSFIAGIPARRRLAAAFKATSVDMRAEQVLQAARSFGTDAVAALSCADLAGSDDPGDAYKVFGDNYVIAHELTFLSAMLALLD
jgi:nucleoside phosphorylase